MEDEAITRIALTVLLEYQGASVVAAGSVAASFQALTQGFHPHLLVSNIRLPDGTGGEVLRYLRRLDDDRGCTTPAIALTGESLDLVRSDPELTGFELYLSKPFDSRRLIVEISRLIESGHI